MCLTKLGKFKPNKFGYKWFDAEGDKLLTAYFLKECPIGKWIKDDGRGKLFCAETIEKYKIGFHIFNRIKEAKDSGWGGFPESVLYRVAFKNIETGYEDGNQIVVAKQMKIIEEVKI